jgi:L-2,4-diaminobutyrate decarboxylase
MAIWEMGQLQTVAELRVVEWMCKKLGFGEQATGHLTSGGSLGNLTALLAAREAKRPGSWADGEKRQRLPCVLVSDQAHYSVERAVQILGWGGDGIEPVRTTADYCLDPTDLGPAYARASARGREVIAVIANACTTATGSFDPLGPIAEFCATERLWMHVDAAHGGSFVLAPSVKDCLAGIERADSVVWDAHKMLMMPALVTGVLFRHHAHAHLAFSQHAEYLFDDGVGVELGHRTFECTKRGMGLSLYSALRVFGESAFTEYLEKTVELARAFAELLDDRAGFERATWPQANIVCFRLAGESHDDLGRACRRKLVASGKYYVVETMLSGRHHFRVTIVSPKTQLRDLEGLLDELEAIAQAGGSAS